jgi:hypothetical protein
MNISQMTNEELGLILTGLRSIFVEELEGLREEMIEKFEAKLSERGLKVGDHE